MTLLLQRKQYRSYRRKAVLKRMWRRVRVSSSYGWGWIPDQARNGEMTYFFIGKQDDPDRDPRGF